MGYTDIHSHVLPGLDDGAKTMEQALAMLKMAEEEGIGTICATPHYMPGKGCPSGNTVKKHLEELREAAVGAGLNIRLLCGMEYYFRQEVLELLDKEEALTLADTELLLVEFDPGAEGSYIRNGICEILDRGYIPVAAHVERYAALMKKPFTLVRQLREMGALIQVNCGSITGQFGTKAKKDTAALLKKGLVDLLGTDAHSDGRRSPRMKECAAFLYKKLGEKYAEELLYAKALGLPEK